MERIVVDQNLPAKLPNLLYPVELCDADGQVLGRYTPDVSGFENLEPPELSEEEWRRRVEEPGGRSLREILADLEARG